MLIALLMGSIWYAFIFQAYPIEARYEWDYNFSHLTEVVKGSGGDVLHYIKMFHWQYGLLAWPLLMLGIYKLRDQVEESYHRKYLMLGIIVVYIFFSVVAKTQLSAYVLIASLPIFLLMAAGMIKVGTFLKKPIYKWVFSTMVVYSLLSPHNLGLVHIENKQTNLVGAEHFPAKKHNTAIYRSLPSYGLSEGTILFNLPEFEDVECMFWSGFNSYHW